MGNTIGGIFDGFSYGFFIGAAIAMVIATWLISPGISPTQATLNVFGSCFRQGFYNGKRFPNKRLSQAFVGLFILYNFVVTIMYSSVVISLLTAKKEGKAIDTLSDLLKEEHKDVRQEILPSEYFIS